MGVSDTIREFLNARLGMFIHFGVYSMLGGQWQGRTIPGEQGEWIMNYLQIPLAEYEDAARQFRPTGFDAEKIVFLARQAGMRYIVITTKHHDGFALFDSKADPYNIVEWGGFGRDIVGELAAACKKHGMKLGFYYSQALDWHEPHAGGWAVPPYRLSPSWGNVWDFPDNSKKCFEIYFEKKVKPQVTELLTNYGDVFLMWFDTPKTISQEQSEELYRLVKSLQPDCLINSRIGNGEGDYGSLGDNEIPTMTLVRPYETPMTLNDSWGYNEFDENWKTGGELIDMLVKLASRNVNLLLNIGPKGDGTVPEGSVATLTELGDWMKENGAAVWDTAGNPAPGEFDWGYATSRGNVLYAIVRADGGPGIEMNGLQASVVRVASLNGKKDIPFTQVAGAPGGACTLRFEIPETGTCPQVFQVVCRSEPVFDRMPCQQGASLGLYPAQAALFDGAWKAADSVVMEKEFLAYESYGKMKIRNSGILAGWRERGHCLEWRARFLQPGTYAVEAVTSAEEFSDGARAASRVAVSVDEESPVEAALVRGGAYGDSRRNLNGVDNTRVVSACGSITIAEAGIHTVRLTLAGVPDAPENIPLIALRFVLKATVEG